MAKKVWSDNFSKQKFGRTTDRRMKLEPPYKQLALESQQNGRQQSDLYIYVDDYIEYLAMSQRSILHVFFILNFASAEHRHGTVAWLLSTFSELVK